MLITIIGGVILERKPFLADFIKSKLKQTFYPSCLVSELASVYPVNGMPSLGACMSISGATQHAVDPDVSCHVEMVGARAGRFPAGNMAAETGR